MFNDGMKLIIAIINAVFLKTKHIPHLKRKTALWIVVILFLLILLFWLN